METFSEILNIVLPLVIALFVILIPVGIIVAVVRFRGAKKITDAWARKRANAISWLIIMVPPILMFISISLWGFVNIISKTFSE